MLLPGEAATRSHVHGIYPHIHWKIVQLRRVKHRLLDLHHAGEERSRRMRGASPLRTADVSKYVLLRQFGAFPTDNTPEIKVVKKKKKVVASQQ